MDVDTDSLSTSCREEKPLEYWRKMSRYKGLYSKHSFPYGHILDIFLPGPKHSKVENPFYISASTSILDPNKTVLILIKQGRSPASPYGAYAYVDMNHATFLSQSSLDSLFNSPGK